MSSVLEQVAAQLKFTELPIEGVKIAEGKVQTQDGVICVSKRKLKEQGKAETAGGEADKANVKTQAKESSAVVKAVSKIKFDQPDSACSVVFETPMGAVTGQYYPVIDAEDFVVMGLTEQSFIPKSYKEAPELLFQLTTAKISTKVVYTGCSFADPDVRRTYIVLMKVKDEKAGK